MRYAFTFDASSCTGCKACQIACKDKNALPAGILWRRVYEITGGEWQRNGAAWTNSVFAYNVSMACNHCAEPACVAACPTGACAVRDDGVVWIDGEKCAGCEYCAWACPYSAPRYSPDLARMTKCDLCRDLLDEGLSPACVAACPMRALDITTAEDDAPMPVVPPPFPLPASSRTQAQIAITPHAAMSNALAKTVANREEVRHAHARSDVPLIAFTLLGQAAAGAAIVAMVTGLVTRPLLVAVGLLGTLAIVLSLLHLGRASQAWRAPANARSSPLSREVLALAAFAAAWLLAWITPDGGVALAITAITLLYAMASVYSLDAVPGWRAQRTRAAFASAALLLGLVVHLIAANVLPVWLASLCAAAVPAHQFVVRRRFYAMRHERAM